MTGKAIFYVGCSLADIKIIFYWLSSIYGRQNISSLAVPSYALRNNGFPIDCPLTMADNDNSLLLAVLHLWPT
jgi:hypothetical protein